MDIVVSEIANIGLTILILVGGWLGVIWLDKNVFNKDRYKKSDKND